MRSAKNNWPAYECPCAAARKSAGQGRSLLTFDTAQVRRLLAEIGAGGRLMALEGIGPITATALVTRVGNARAFKSGRQFAAWPGLTPRQNSSGGKTSPGAISVQQQLLK
jgi:transposase